MLASLRPTTTTKEKKNDTAFGGLRPYGNKIQ